MSEKLAFQEVDSHIQTLNDITDTWTLLTNFSVMGFIGFDTTKNTKVKGNSNKAIFAARLQPKPAETTPTA